MRAGAYFFHGKGLHGRGIKALFLRFPEPADDPDHQYQEDYTYKYSGIKTRFKYPLNCFAGTEKK
jgi:hypothetical protein